jgi:NAD(P)-dependent dehydrogenase (short-subunit alcohol dehydrogenase family)
LVDIVAESSTLDVREPASIRDAIAAGIECFGKIDALINNASYRQYGLFEAMSASFLKPRPTELIAYSEHLEGHLPVTRLDVQKQQEAFIQ